MKKIIFYFAIFIVAFILTREANHEVRKIAQHNKTLHEIIMATDCFSFMLNGGGSFGY